MTENPAHRPRALSRGALPLVLVACAARSPSSTRPSAPRESRTSVVAQPAPPVVTPPRDAAPEPPTTASVRETTPAEPPGDATTDTAHDALRRAPVPACLRGDERVSVTGHFDPAVGTVYIEPTDPSPGLRPSASRCVARALNDLRVPPGGGRHDFYWNFTAHDAVASPEGTVDARQVTAAIRERLPQIRACYETQWRARPTLQGRVNVWFTLNTRGVITRMIARSSSTAFADVGACFVFQIRGATMPPANGGDVEIVFPFTFRADSVAGGMPTTTRSP